MQNRKIWHKLTSATSAGSVAYAGGKEATPVASVRLEPAQGKKREKMFLDALASLDFKLSVSQ